MEANQLFKIGQKTYKHMIFKVILKDKNTCVGCAGNGNQSLCKALPACIAEINKTTTTQIVFSKLNPIQTRQAIKNNATIIQF